MHTSVAMPDGSIVMMGGYTSGAHMNDVWRFMPAGSSAQNPSHTYTMPGIYPVALQVYNAGGYNSTRKTGYITVSEAAPPVAGFSGTPTTGINPLTVVFTDESSGVITSYLWDFGDTATSPKQNPWHTYTNTGTNTVTLTVTGPGGRDTKTQTDYITVMEPSPPVANAGPDQTVIVNKPVIFDGSGSTDSDGTIVSYAWDFGDTHTGSGVTTTNVYTAAGTYTVTLTVTDNGGLTGSDTAVITVKTPGSLEVKPSPSHANIYIKLR
jgi:PKD repeat protein